MLDLFAIAIILAALLVPAMIVSRMVNDFGGITDLRFRRLVFLVCIVASGTFWYYAIPLNGARKEAEQKAAIHEAIKARERAQPGYKEVDIFANLPGWGPPITQAEIDAAAAKLKRR
jgi:hypothetical protein